MRPCDKKEGERLSDRDCSNWSIRLPHVVISDTELVAAIQSISSKESIRVHDFTTLLDERKILQTVGFIAELSAALRLGTSRRLLKQLLTEIRCRTERSCDI